MDKDSHPKLRLDQLAEHFRLPFQDAAAKLGICQTSLKKICRQLGVGRWPQRKLRCIDKKIASVKTELSYLNTDDVHLSAELNVLEADRRAIFMGANDTGPVDGSTGQSGDVMLVHPLGTNVMGVANALPVPVQTASMAALVSNVNPAFTVVAGGTIGKTTVVQGVQGVQSVQSVATGQRQMPPRATTTGTIATSIVTSTCLANDPAASVTTAGHDGQEGRKVKINLDGLTPSIPADQTAMQLMQSFHSQWNPATGSLVSPGAKGPSRGYLTPGAQAQADLWKQFGPPGSFPKTPGGSDANVNLALTAANSSSSVAAGTSGVGVSPNAVYNMCHVDVAPLLWNGLEPQRWPQAQAQEAQNRTETASSSAAAASSGQGADGSVSTSFVANSIAHSSSATSTGRPMWTVATLQPQTPKKMWDILSPKSVNSVAAGKGTASNGVGVGAGFGVGFGGGDSGTGVAVGKHGLPPLAVGSLGATTNMNVPGMPSHMFSPNAFMANQFTPGQFPFSPISFGPTAMIPVGAEASPTWRNMMLNTPMGGGINLPSVVPQQMATSLAAAMSPTSLGPPTLMATATTATTTATTATATVAAAATGLAPVGVAGDVKTEPVDTAPAPASKTTESNKKSVPSENGGGGEAGCAEQASIAACSDHVSKDPLSSSQTPTETVSASGWH